MSSATFTYATHIEAHVDIVWQRLQSEETWRLIGSVHDVWDARHDEGGSLRGYRWSAVVGPTTYRGSADVTVSQPRATMSLAIASSEITGMLTARLEGRGRGTDLDVTLAITSKGVMATLLFPVVASAVGDGLPAQVDAFADTLR